MSSPTPRLKPTVESLPPGSEACGCGAGIMAETPQGVSNRPGLSAIRYRIGDHARFDASLRANLSSSRFAPLAGLRTRDADDFTLGLVDAFACAADVLTFYQERIANESYLRTATERVSLQEMGRLVGYRLRPGVAAETWLAFALDTAPVPPPKLAPEPGNFVTGVPDRIALDAGLKVQSVPGPGETPQVFETVEAVAEARAAWNAMRPWTAEPRAPARGHTEAFLAGVRNDLKAGDAIVVVGPEFDADAASNRWDFRILASVELQPDDDRTRIAWKRGLGSIAPPTDPPSTPRLFALRKRAAAFGHNAPMWRAMSTDFRTHYVDGGEKLGDWPDFVLGAAGSNTLDLDGVQAEIGNGSLVVLAKGGFDYASEPAPAGTYVELYRVANASAVSRAQFALSGKVTRLALAGDNYDRQFRTHVRETAVFAQSELLALSAYPVVDAIEGHLVPVEADARDLRQGRRLIVRGLRVRDGAAVVAQVVLVGVSVSTSAAGAMRCVLDIAPPLPAALQRDSVVVHANVALASHGETVAQILGAGDASSAFQRFELKQGPLTWRAAANETGAAPEITVRIGEVAWTQRTTLFEAGPQERAYSLVTDEQDRVFVQFGDGVRGARLPSRSNNVRATYRKGLGADGNLAADRLTQLLSRPLGLKSVSNPTPASGGTDPEPPEAARQSIPLTTRTLGRAVSVLDYEDFARAFSGIAKAQAQALTLRGGTAIAITLAAPDGASIDASSPTWTHLLDALRASGDPHVALRLLPCRVSTFRLGLQVKCDPAFDAKAVLSAVESALREAFGFEARALSQPVQQSEAIAIAQGVEGVVAVDMTRLYGGTQPLPQTRPSLQVRLLAARMRVADGQALPAELLVLDAAPFDQLEAMP